VPLTLENPVTLEKWQQILSAVDSATTFHDHATTFKGSQAVRLSDDLQKILDQFGKEVQTATFAVRHGLVEGAWLDPFHNYIATVFSKATGDDDDFVVINSISGGPSHVSSLDKKLIKALRAATRVVILTGAGVSAESGIPTFRDKQTGLWENFDAAELATPYAFERDPALVWGWYEWRRQLVLKSEPNAAHNAIAAMADRVPHFTLITQNVDDLHERAGSCNVLHLHGELSRPYCESCHQLYTHPTQIPPPPSDGARLEPPRCIICGAQIRPGVVWFGENLPQDQWTAARDAAQHCDVFLVVGTSSLVQPAASLTDMAANAGATTIQVNPNPTDADSSVTFTLRGPAGTVLPQLVSETWGLL
jgi:NAD-dependent deacetylase